MRTHIQRAGTLLGLAIALPAAQAGTLTTSGADMTLSGGFTAGYNYTSNSFGPGPQTDPDDYTVSDFLIDLSGESMNGGVAFTAAYGLLSMPSVWDGGVTHPNPTSSPAMGFQYGYVSVPTGGGVTIDAGKLATNIGYEVAPTYANANILLGAVWYEQPVYYTGVRATWGGDGINVYVEANDDTVPHFGSTANNRNAVFGVNGSAGGFNYAVSYENAFFSDGKDILDIIVSHTFGGIDTALNLDYLKLDTTPAAPPNADDSAYGLALYATFPVSSMVSVPVRVEYMNDGTSGLYEGVDTGYTFTVTPTYRPTDTTFVRAELAYISAKNDLFYDDKNKLQGTNTSFALQGGVTF